MRYISFFLLTLSLTACSTSTDSNSEQPTPVIPLALGNTWVFDIEMNNEITTDSLFVISDTLIGQTTWYKLYTDDPEIRACISGYFTNLDNGFYLYTGAKNAPENLLLFEINPTKNEPRFIDTGFSAWLNIYMGQIFNEDHNLTGDKYAIEYEYLVSNGITYHFDKAYQFNRVVSPEVGFILWEGAYMGKMNDSTLTLRDNFRLILQEFIQGNEP